jgi:integrase
MEKIREVDLAQVLAGRRGKTNVEYMVPLLPGAVEILKKYNGLPYWRNGKSLLTNQKYNKYLKEVVKEVGIDRPVTTHWARHTGATLLLNLKVPLQIVSKVCGHSSTKMTERIYAKLLDRTVVQEVMAVKDKL